MTLKADFSMKCINCKKMFAYFNDDVDRILKDEVECDYCGSDKVFNGVNV